MIVTAIYGTEHVGSTVHLARMAIETLQPDEVHEFFLPVTFITCAPAVMPVSLRQFPAALPLTYKLHPYWMPSTKPTYSSLHLLSTSITSQAQ